MACLISWEQNPKVQPEFTSIVSFEKITAISPNGQWVKGLITPRSGGNYGNNSWVICFPAQGHPTGHVADRLWSILIITWLNNFVSNHIGTGTNTGTGTRSPLWWTRLLDAGSCSFTFRRQGETTTVSHQESTQLCCNWYYNMTVYIWAGNVIKFSIAVGLIRLHICPVSSNLVCNEGERMSAYSGLVDFAMSDNKFLIHVIQW